MRGNMKISYNLKQPKQRQDKILAAAWMYGLPLFFLPVAGIVETPLNVLFFIVGAIPLFVRFDL